MTSLIDDPLAPVAELNGLGNPFHGWLQDGALYRLDGVAMALPSGMQHYAVSDGSARLIDLGMPAATTSDEDKAKGMTWWNKALLCGAGMASERIYNPVHGTSVSAIQVRRGAFPYRAADGSVYWIWYSGDKKIRAELVGAPASTLPQNDTGGTERVDLSSVVPYSRIIGTYEWPLYTWVNFAPNGSQFSLHSGYMDSNVHYTYQIIEFSVTGGDATTPPTVTQTSYRSLETDGELVTDTATSTVVHHPEWIYNHYLTLPDFKSGTEYQSSLIIWCVDYDVSGQRTELSILTESQYTYTTFAVDAPYYEMQTDREGGIYIQKNGIKVLTIERDKSVQPTTDPASLSVIISNPIKGYPRLINGNAVVATDPAASTQTNGQNAAVNVTLYGAVTANGVAGNGTAAMASGVSVRNLAFDPQTGAYVAGRTRYF